MNAFISFLVEKQQRIDEMIQEYVKQEQAPTSFLASLFQSRKSYAEQIRPLRELSKQIGLCIGQLNHMFGLLQNVPKIHSYSYEQIQRLYANFKYIMEFSSEFNWENGKEFLASNGLEHLFFLFHSLELISKEPFFFLSADKVEQYDAMEYESIQEFSNPFQILEMCLMKHDEHETYSKLCDLHAFYQNEKRLMEVYHKNYQEQQRNANIDLQNNCEYLLKQFLLKIQILEEKDLSVQELQELRMLKQYMNLYEKETSKVLKKD